MSLRQSLSLALDWFVVRALVVVGLLVLICADSMKLYNRVTAKGRDRRRRDR